MNDNDDEKLELIRLRGDVDILRGQIQDERTRSDAMARVIDALRASLRDVRRDVESLRGDVFALKRRR